MSATAVIANVDGAKMVELNQEDLDENAADDEDNDVDVGSMNK